VSDITAQRIACARILSLSLCLCVGSGLPLSTSEGCKWGEDPTLSQLAKGQSKAGHRILKDILGDANVSELNTHFVDLMREFAEAKRVEEAALVGSWWAEISACFGMEKMVLVL